MVVGERLITGITQHIVIACKKAEQKTKYSIAS